jgi:23S rRNA (guanosine2251-2'-O)-methyltransferase
MTDGAVHQGVVLRRRLPQELALSDYIETFEKPSSLPLLLVLDQVQDPHNFGACLRVADGAGADAVLAPRDHSAPISGTMAKAASGALDSIPLIFAPNLARALDAMRNAGMWFIGASHDAKSTIYESDLAVPLGLVFGGEGHGLRDLTRKKCDELASIPMGGTVASLNVSTAAAIALFEARRRRMHECP